MRESQVRALVELSADILGRADKGMGQALAMRDAATVLRVTQAFVTWAIGRPEPLDTSAVVHFLMGYGKQLIDEVREPTNGTVG